jgi:Tfp pilus assembly protein PilF
MAVLLFLVLGYVTRSWWDPIVHAGPNEEPPLAGDNSISNLVVSQDADGRWIATFQYFYTGRPSRAWTSIHMEKGENTSGGFHMGWGHQNAERGRHERKVEIQRPSQSAPHATTSVTAQLVGNQKALTTQTVAQRIDWPDLYTWSQDRNLARKSTQQILDSAVALIDEGRQDSLAEAKQFLERILARDSQFDAAYVELARVAMKSNWGPEGLRQAESLIASALQIRPDSVNAKILLGYVYAHQGRFGQAEALFAEAAKTDTKNTWLWANWGEVLAMQGKFDLASAKYRETIARPPSNDTYDRARLDAYKKLLALQERKSDLDGMEALYQQRAAEYGGQGCLGADHARFVLFHRGQVREAIALARTAYSGADVCGKDQASEVLALAYYTASVDASNPSRGDALNRARAFLPLGPRALYLLASSDRTAKVIPQFVTKDEGIDQVDNRNLNALAHALLNKDVAAARRLLRLGARPERTIGPANIPVALLPVIDPDVAAVRAFQQAGVDYGKLKVEGISAVEIARRSGDKKVIEAIERGTSSL